MLEKANLIEVSDAGPFPSEVATEARKRKALSRPQRSFGALTRAVLVPACAADLRVASAMQYQTLRSVSGNHVFVICYDGRFDELPDHVRHQGPWQGMHRGEIEDVLIERTKCLVPRAQPPTVLPVVAAVCPVSDELAEGALCSAFAPVPLQ